MKKVFQTPVAYDSAAWYPWSDVLRDQFTFRDKYEPKKEVNIWTKKGKLIGLPRGVCKAAGVHNMSYGHDINVPSSFAPKNDEQARVIKESVSKLSQGRSFIIQAPTGWGKTAVALEVIRKVGKSALVVVTKEDVKTGWLKEIQKFWGLDSKGVGIIQGDRYSVSGKPISIAMVHSICKPGRYPAWVYRAFGLVLFDEVHRMGADTFSEACWLLPARLRVGLSATPKRNDGRTQVFQSHIGKVEVVSEEMPSVPKVLVAMVSNKYLKHVTQKMGRIATLVNVLSKDSMRSKGLTRFAKEAFAKGRYPVLFSDTLIHLEILRDYLVMAGVPASKIGFYVGGKSAKALQEAATAGVTLCTYKMASEATNMPHWDTAILCTPKANVVQIVGRILREVSGKKQPIVLDVVDADSWVLSRYYDSRYKWYSSSGFEVKYVHLQTA